MNPKRLCTEDQRGSKSKTAYYGLYKFGYTTRSGKTDFKGTV